MVARAAVPAYGISPEPPSHWASGTLAAPQRRQLTPLISPLLIFNSSFLICLPASPFRSLFCSPYPTYR
jgi:hypothetical protein